VFIVSHLSVRRGLFVRKCPIQVPPVAMIYLSKMLWAVLVSGRSVNDVFIFSLAYLKRLAGIRESWLCFAMGSEGNG
jgi:hypothetical protein